MSNVYAQAAAALACPEPDRKCALTATLREDWLAGRLDEAPQALPIAAGRRWCRRRNYPRAARIRRKDAPP